MSQSKAGDITEINKSMFSNYSTILGPCCCCLFAFLAGATALAAVLLTAAWGTFLSSMLSHGDSGGQPASVTVQEKDITF